MTCLMDVLRRRLHIESNLEDGIGILNLLGIGLGLEGGGDIFVGSSMFILDKSQTNSEIQLDFMRDSSFKGH